MKLQRLRIDRLPGIEGRLDLADLAPGLNIIIGPNGIGKSRICAALRALLWQEREVAGGGLAARADFEHEGSHWQVAREGTHHRWQKEGIDVAPPVLPGAQLDGCFFLGLRDLLDASETAGHKLAAEIRKQMSGGFDLDLVERQFVGVLTKSIGKKESRALDSAEKQIVKAARGQIELARRERTLESLEARAGEAERASKRLTAFTTAISLQSLRADHRQRAKELAELPAALANLDGKEIIRLDKLDESLAQKRTEHAAASDARRESVETARSTRLESPIDAVALDTWRERAEKLTDLEGRIETASAAEARARAALRERRRILGADDPGESGSEGDAKVCERLPAIEEGFDLFAFLRESQKHASERDVLVERLNLLTARRFSEEDARRLELLRRGVEPLRRWLRAPDPDIGSVGRAERFAWRKFALAGTVLFAVGLGFRWLSPFATEAAIVLGVGTGLVLAGLFSWFGLSRGKGGDEGTNWRSVAVTQFPESLGQPDDWSTEAVGECLSQLEDQLTSLDASGKRARDREVERGQLEENLNGLTRRSEDLEAQRQILLGRIGLDSLRPDVELVDLARALDEARAAQVEADEAMAQLSELGKARARLLVELGKSFEQRGEVMPLDGVSARATVHVLADRDRSLRGARADEAREGHLLERLNREIEGLQADEAELFAAAEIESGDRAELTRLLGQLDRYRELSVEVSKLVGGIERKEFDLEALEEAALARIPIAGLEEEYAVVERRSADLQSLNAEIVEIRVEARNTRSGHVLEEAIAEKGAAMDALRDRRDEALAARAGQCLVESVRHEHETNQMPRVLERARDRFARFTHHRYRLDVSPGEGGSFVAVDAKTGEGLSPDKLSDGTRAQLILAARMAFAEEAEEAEHGANLPLFLDEAMDHSDPDRFHAIAASLAGMAKEDGRQIFYLTNDPTDIDRFARAFEEVGSVAPKVVDLAKIRGLASSLDEATALRVEPFPAVPPPADQDAEAYGMAIGVTALDPSREAFGQHLYYVMRDDLTLLHRLLEARIVSVGQCLNVLKGGSALARSITTQSEVGAGLEARIELLDVFCVAWREGRGRPVRRLELEQSDAVSEKFIDAFAEVAAESEGSAGEIMARLRERTDARLSGFRKKSTEVLEQFFLDHGYLDDRAMLGEEEIIQRALGTPASNRLSPKETVGLVHQWWRLSLQGGLQGGRQSGRPHSD